jgi:threonylcarbamoyladenosine tRNA methylthiotransferase MtaB
MQSGCSRILRQMRRPYSAPDYRALVERIRHAIPDAATGADVMVGFPGESDDDFMETYRLIESSPLTYLHVFPYSPRPGTLAAALPNPVPDHVTRFRGQHLRSLIARKNMAFRESFLGRNLQVLVLDQPAAAGYRPGLSDNFIKVDVPSELAVNRWHPVRGTGVTEAGLRVETVSASGQTR